MGRDLVRSGQFVGAVVAIAGGLVFAPATGRAADHRDGPRVTNNATTLGALDLNDLYGFLSPANRNNVVLVQTMGGAGVGVVTPPFFFPGAVYELRISNDGDPTTDEIIYQFAFSDPDAFLRQSYIMVAKNGRTGFGTLVAEGVTGRNVPLVGGGQVTAGIFDDPFFFDTLAFNKFKKEVAIGAPLAARIAPFLPPNIPNNFFGNFNVLAIVLELPRTRLVSRFRNPTISVWSRSLMPNGTQFDRQGLPAINTALNFESPALGTANVQDFFNSLIPLGDVSLFDFAANRINLYYGLPIAQAEGLARKLLPDVLTINTATPTAFLNGRSLTDDVIDAELNLLTGGALKGDRVINDSVFRLTFPYIGTALPRSATLSANRALRKLEEQDQSPAPSQGP